MIIHEMINVSLSTIIGTAIPFLFLLLGVAPLIGLVFWWRKQLEKEERHSPLTRDMLRPAGYSLNEKLTDYDVSAYGELAALMCMPLLGYGIYMTQTHLSQQPHAWWRAAIISVVVFSFMFFSGRRLTRAFKRRRQIQLAFEGELATGQELDQLMLLGCRVFHDIPTDYGNIDHVVVSHSGVYTVETKTVRKPIELKDSNVTIDYRKDVIRFPHCVSPIPMKQLETQSNWLTKNLRSSIGEEIKVEPMLALPGWFIENRIGRGSAYVFNPVSPHKCFVHDRHVLAPQMIQRIAHQLEQLCRDVPRSQRKERQWAVD